MYIALLPYKHSVFHLPHRVQQTKMNVNKLYTVLSAVALW